MILDSCGIDDMKHGRFFAETSIDGIQGWKMRNMPAITDAVAIAGMRAGILALNAGYEVPDDSWHVRSCVQVAQDNLSALIGVKVYGHEKMPIESAAEAFSTPPNISKKLEK